jgi:hypothetical protein
VVLPALREYLRRPAGTHTTHPCARRAGSRIAAQVETAKADRTHSVLRPYLKALA